MILAACLTVITANVGIIFSFGVFFKSLEEEFGWTRALTSGVFSLSSLLSSVFVVVGGWNLDRYGPRVIFTVMGFSTALGLFLTSQASTLVHLYLSYSLLLAIGTGASYVVVASTVSRWFARRRGLAIAIATSGGGLGPIIMTPVAAYLISSYGWRTSYLIMGLMALFIIVPCAQLLRKVPSKATALTEGERLELINWGSPEESGSNEAKAHSLSQAVKTRNFWLFVFIWLFFAYTLYMVLSHVVRHGIDMGLTTMQAGTVLSMIGGASIIGRLVMGRVSDSKGRKQVAMICALFLAVAMLFLTMASSLWTLYLFAVIFGLSFGGFSPPMVALVGETFGLRYLGAIMGVIETGWCAGAALGPALTGHIFDIQGSYYLSFLSGVISMLTVIVLIRFLKAPRLERGT